MDAQGHQTAANLDREEALIRWVNYAGLITPTIHRRLTHAMDSANALHDIFAGVHSVVGQMMETEGFCVALYDSSTQLVHYPYVADSAGSERGAHRLGHGLIDHVIRIGRPLLATRQSVLDMLRRGEVDVGDDLPAEWLGAPLSVSGQVIGVLAVHSRQMPARLRDRDVDVLAFVALRLARAIIERRTEFELHVTRDRLRRLMSASPTVIYSCTPIATFEVTFISENVVLQLGHEPKDFIAHVAFWGERLHPEDAPSFWAARASFWEREQHAYEYRFRHKDGTYRWIHDEMALLKDETGRPVEIVGAMTDITERRTIEAKLRQAQKMESIGTLAGGIAHDFNNILAAMLGYTEITLRALPEGSNERKCLGEVLKAGDRATNLVRQILAFGRQQETGRKPLSLGRLVDEGLALLRATLPSTIEIRRRSTVERDTIFADPVQIQQVVMNLGSNAGYAMRQQGGVLEVELDSVYLEEDYAATRNGAAKGRYLLLRVTDTGHGIPADIIGRIFDPFFTTKDVGEGTGMGLSIVHGIVTGHGGHITVYSEPAKGTTFHIYLPQVGEAAPPEPMAERPVPHGTGRVLFVDDEPALVAMGKERLERLGYEVVGAIGSIEALEVFNADPDGFDLVVTDQTMPKLTGEGLARAILQVRPGVPIILCSGFSPTMTVEKAQALGIRAYLLKPVATLALAEAVQRAMGSTERE